MELTNGEKTHMISVLSTLNYNTFEDLKNNLNKAKKIISNDSYNLLLSGDSPIFDETVNVKDTDKYKKISILEGRWCLESQLFYHLTKTKKITHEEYNEIMKLH